jgi:hypothetical protein
MSARTRGSIQIPWFTLSALSLVAAGQAIARMSDAEHRAIVERFGISWPHLAALRLHRLATALIVQEQPGFSLPILGLLAACCPWYERARGAPRAATVFFVSDVASTLVSLSAFRIGAAAGSERAGRWANGVETGASVGAFGSLGAYAAVARGRRKAVALTLGMASFLVPMVRRVSVSDIQHGLGFVAGFGLACLIDRAWPQGPRR